MSLEDRVKQLEDRVAKLEGLSKGKKPTSASRKTSEIEGLLVAKIEEIGTQDLIVIALRLKPKQTKAELKAMLENWGKAVGNWFQGGNFNTRLLKKSIVKKVGVDEKGDDSYSLTMKGENLAQKLTDEL